MSKDSLLQLSRRRLSPALFALIALGFMLPFATVACNGAQTTFTGVELATWRVPAGGPVDESECNGDLADCVEDSGSVAAAVALIAALAGFVLGASALRRGEGWCTAAGLVAMLALVAQTVQVFGPDITLHSGFVIALFLYAWLALLHVWRAFRRRRRRRRAPWKAQISSR
jgi:hypothetical protein